MLSNLSGRFSKFRGPSRKLKAKFTNCISFTRCFCPKVTIVRVTNNAVYYKLQLIFLSFASGRDSCCVFCNS